MGQTEERNRMDIVGFRQEIIKIRLMEIIVVSVSRFFYFVSFQSLFIFPSPFFHRFDDRAHGFAEF